MSNTQKRIEFNEKFGMLSVFARFVGIRFICTSYTRTAEEQKILFDKDLSERDGIIKVSYHQLDRARDIAIIGEDGNVINDYKDHPSYTVLGEFWESLGGRWGGRWYKEGKTKFNDIFHFEL